jgi:hypothetical protein
VPLRALFEAMADGESVGESVKRFPDLQAEEIKNVLRGVGLLVDYQLHEHSLTLKAVELEASKGHSVAVTAVEQDGYAPPMSQWTPENQTCSTTCPETGSAVRQPVYIVGMKTRRTEKLTQKRDVGFQICFISFGPVESSWMGKGFQCDPR